MIFVTNSHTHRPVGVFEMDKFSTGSRQVLGAVVSATEKGATSIIGTVIRQLEEEQGCNYYF